MKIRLGPLALLTGLAAANSCTAAPTPPPPTPTSTTSSTSVPFGGVTAVPLPSASLGTQQPTSTSIVLSQPPGTYTLPMYLLCGHQFGLWDQQDLYTYPDLPRSLTKHGGADPETSGISIVVVLDADCDHGGSVSVAPNGAADVTPLALASDGLPLVEEVVPKRGQAGTIIFTPSVGEPISTTFK